MVNIRNLLIVFVASIVMALVLTLLISPTLFYIFDVEWEWADFIPNKWRKQWYNHKYDLSNRLKQLEDIETRYTVIKHDLHVISDILIDAINICNTTYDLEDCSEVSGCLAKICVRVDNALIDITHNEPRYSIDDLNYIYSHMEIFCEYMSRELYLNNTRKMDEIINTLKIECLPYYIELSSHIQTVNLIDKSGDY